jgi:hypothetical protein
MTPAAAPAMLTTIVESDVTAPLAIGLRRGAASESSVGVAFPKQASNPLRRTID